MIQFIVRLALYHVAAGCGGTRPFRFVVGETEKFSAVLVAECARKCVAHALWVYTVLQLTIGKRTCCKYVGKCACGKCCALGGADY